MNSKVTKCFVTLSEMFHDRGYEKEAELLSNLDIKEKIIFNIDIDDYIKIIFNLSKKIKMAEIKKLIMEESFKKYIIVTLDKLSQANIKSVNELNLDVQFFHVSELLFNITKHSLVPKHVLINDDKQIKSIMEKFSVKSKAQLPILLKNDPVAKYHDAKPGNLMMITRSSPSAGEHVIYRYVV